MERRSEVKFDFNKKLGFGKFDTAKEKSLLERIDSHTNTGKRKKEKISELYYDTKKLLDEKSTL